MRSALTLGLLLGAAWPLAALASDEIVARAVRPDVPSEVAALIAARAKPTVLTPERYPAIPEASGVEVAEALCGTVDAVYWTAFRQENGLPASFDPKRELGRQAYSYRWPACLYVERGEFEHLVKAGDRAEKVFKSATGAEAPRPVQQRFFAGSKVKSIDDIDPGDVLRFRFQSRPVLLESRDGVGSLGTELSRVSSSWRGIMTADTTGGSAPPAGIEGEIIGAATAAGSVQSGAAVPLDCNGRGGRPLDLSRAAAAFAYEPGSHPDPVNVLVVDNGFFGASRTLGKVSFSPRFRSRFFRVLDDGQGVETIGPTLSWEQGLRVTPFNREALGAAAVPDGDSGHGTHVAGLIIGGAASDNPELFGADPKNTWLHLNIVAFSPGQRKIPSLSANQFDEAVRQVRLARPDIVNMSLKFGSAAATSLRSLIKGRPDTLFVVAAGNDRADLNAPEARIYPAVLSQTEDNVLVVGAEDGLGNLSEYSNRGAAVVDILAPGCNLMSTLDGVGEAPLSGTSQAAPLVTLAAALLAVEKLEGLEGVGIKRRLIQSGDLIEGSIALTPTGLEVRPVRAATLVPVRSRSRLNMAKALFVRRDYLRFIDDDGTTVEALGTLGARVGPDCKAGNSFNEVVSFKRSRTDSSAWCFWRSSLEPVLVSEQEGQRLDFEIVAVLDREGRPHAAQRQVVGLPLARVQEFVMSHPRARVTWGE